MIHKKDSFFRKVGRGIESGVRTVGEGLGFRQIDVGDAPQVRLGDPTTGLGDVYYQDFKPEMLRAGELLGQAEGTISGMQGTVADIQKRAAAPLGLSEAYGKAADVIGEQKIAGLEEAGRAGQQAGMRAISQGGLYGASGGGGRERALSRASKTAQEQQQATRRGTQQQLGAMASADLQAGLQRRQALQDQVMGAQGSVLAGQRGIAGSRQALAQGYQPTMAAQQGIISGNIAAQNQQDLANYQAQNAARAAQADRFSKTFGTVAKMFTPSPFGG